ncbi:hypothetical protein CCACVL1_10525 [Corchorus capsularis]|uniref:Uncharacterized protein n=1 Tax=Corchorus capsularis TaxID=210143 RepID=A0A1R3IQV5_COCAP|nr:hypothetical protein CCACVL1_10525 [Corchorus capsularis]
MVPQHSNLNDLVFLTRLTGFNTSISKKLLDPT